MFRKRFSALLVALAALDASSALGLGLGEITLQSALNEPLKAQIRLRGTEDLGPEQIIVRLAPSADFERSGIERLYALTEMRFEVKTGGAGEGVVYLRTDQPVREPYMDFLLEVRWPNGRVLREYTVLLDLPTYSAAPTPSVQAPATRAPARPSVTPRSDGGGAWSGGPSYDVRSGDTLWSIAKRARGAGVSVQQMLEALHRDNPEAFVDGDIDRLRAGAVLRIPAELSSGAVVEAPGVAQDDGSASQPPTEAPASAPSSTASTADSSYLRLTGDVAADAEGGAVGGVPGGTASGSTSEDLAAVQEDLSAKERENAELASRVKALEEQVKDYQRVVDLKSDGMAAAQSAATAPPPEAAPANPPAAAPAPQSAEEQGLLASVMQNGLAIGVALLAMFLATLAFLVVRRRRTAPSYAPLPTANQRFRSGAREEPPTQPAAAEPFAPAAPVSAPSPAMVSAPAAPTAAVAAPAAVAAATAVAAPSASKVFDLSKTAPAAQADETYDPLAEADMFVAYGRHERALEVLRASLADDPEQMDVRLKLMEILAVRNAQDDFLAEYDRILALGSDDDVQAARTLAVETGHPYWLAALDAPAGIQPQDAGSAPSLLVTRSLAPEVEEDHAPELSSLDLELQAPLTEPASADLDLDLDLDAASLQADEQDLDTGDLPGLDHGDLGDLDFGSLELDGAEPSVDLPDDAGEALAPDTEVSFDPGPSEDDALHLDLEPSDGADPEPAIAASPEPSAEDATDIDLLEGTDEVETRLELARAFIEMGDTEGAQDILEEVAAEGSDSQRAAATALLDTLKSG